MIQKLNKVTSSQKLIYIYFGFKNILVISATLPIDIMKYTLPVQLAQGLNYDKVLKVSESIYTGADISLISKLGGVLDMYT